MFFATDVHARGCSISDFKMSPNPPYTLGTHVQLYVKSNCGTVRFEINGQAKAEIGSSEQWETWKTEEFGSGTHTVCAVARGDGGWENADRRCQDVYVSGGQGPTTGGTNDRCYVTSFTVTPASGPIGTVFNLSSQGQCDGNMRAARYSIDGSGFGEHSNNTYNTGWSSSGYSSGTHTICYLVTSGNWSQAAQSCVTISLTVDGSPGNDVAEGDQTAPETGGTGPSGQSQGSDASSCQGSALSLSPGDTARISPGLDNNLRRNPSTDSSLIGSIPAGGSFTILDGPRCGNGYWWWEVAYNGKEGWTAEGSGSDLWISKINTNANPTPTPKQPTPTPMSLTTNQNNDQPLSPVATPAAKEMHACSQGGCILRESGTTNWLFPVSEPYRGTCPGQDSLSDRIKDSLLKDWIVRFPVEQWGSFDPADVRLWGEWFTGIRNTRLDPKVAIIGEYEPLTLCISGWTFFPSDMWIWLKQ